ncbi:hypothetical protein [Variovorax sp. EL159]|uniref:hypothetical protein n=1 Tax=Variovorax sp. EL159 TaxID=1566270 RepID=UPI00088345F6|nr:hypothetical protein [Variovorax sp. EL159]SCX74659.1 hypothetical protein SAMN03159363_6406 [Variovorax sp. EL159]
MKYAFHAAILGLAMCSAVLAQPSGGFYLLKNKDSGKVLCSQNPISPDWVRQLGPFKDKDCKIEQKPEPVRTDLPASPLDLAPKK